MAIERGYKVLANDVANTLDSLNSAYKKVNSRSYTWANKPVYGDLIMADLISEIKNVANACLKAQGTSCKANYTSVASNTTTDTCNVEINEVKNYSG